MHGISMGCRTPLPAGGPYLKITPPGAGISIRVVCCHRSYRLAIYFGALVTTCKSHSTRSMNYIAYKPRYFYKYVPSSITIGVRSGKWCCKNRYQWPEVIAMRGSIKCGWLRFHRVWNGLFARRAFWGC